MQRLEAAFIQIEPSVGPFEYEQKHGVVEIKKENEVVGYNIFNVSNNVTINDNGHIKLTTELIKDLQQLITEAGFDYQLDTDVSPKFVVGYVETKEKHPNADCGAPNVESGQKVVVAKVGAVMPSGMVIKDAQLRGVDSSGMICSMKELNLPNAPKEKGIMVLNDDYDIGQAFFE
ncbi:MAG: DUF4479 domain-containing protein [Staphylococcus epidermidis]|nr:DUF4479 domain-containing protein [Staphylococcus epidermidis]